MRCGGSREPGPFLANGRSSLQNPMDVGDSAIFMDQAKQLGLDLDEFQKDLESPECRARVGADAMYAKSIGVKTAPSVVINGYNVPNTEFSENGFRSAIRAALAKAGQ